jgi:hypothetical protein
MATVPHQEKIDIGRVVQRGFSAIGGNLLPFTLIALLFAALPGFAMNYVLLGQATAGGGLSFGASYWGSYAALLLLTVFGAYLLQATVVRSVILELSGRDTDVQGSLVAALGLVLPMIGLTIVSSIAIAFGMLLLLVPGIILYVMWIVAVPVLVEERTGVFGSLSRSAELTKGSRWQIFGLLVLFIIFSWVVGLAFGLLGAANPLEQPIMFAVSNGIAALINGVVMAAMLASLYFELRTVKEGATTDSLASIFE